MKFSFWNPGGGPIFALLLYTPLFIAKLKLRNLLYICFTCFTLLYTALHCFTYTALHCFTLKFISNIAIRNMYV
jgi:hypothetical protein